MNTRNRPYDVICITASMSRGYSLHCWQIPNNVIHSSYAPSRTSQEVVGNTSPTYGWTERLRQEQVRCGSPSPAAPAGEPPPLALPSQEMGCHALLIMFHNQHDRTEQYLSYRNYSHGTNEKTNFPTLQKLDHNLDTKISVNKEPAVLDENIKFLPCRVRLGGS